MQEQKVNIKLTPSQVQLVLKHLAHAPYNIIQLVINEIYSQAQQQLNLNGAGPVEEEEGEIEAAEQ